MWTRRLSRDARHEQWENRATFRGASWHIRYRGERSWSGLDLLPPILRLPDGRWVSNRAGVGAASVRVCGSLGTGPAEHARQEADTKRRGAQTIACPTMRQGFAASTVGFGAANAKGYGFLAIEKEAMVLAPRVVRTVESGAETMRSLRVRVSAIGGGATSVRTYGLPAIRPKAFAPRAGGTA